MVQADNSESITYSATLDKTYFETLTMNNQHFQVWNSRKLRLASLWNTARCLMLLIGMLGSVLNKIVADQWNLPAQPPRRMNNQRLWKILYKGEDTLRTVPRSFITNFLKVYHEVKRCDLTNTVYFDQKNTKNYYITDYIINDPKHSSQNSILDCFYKLEYTVFYGCLTKIVLPYPLNKPENGIRKFTTNDEHETTNTRLCFSILETIYVSFYMKIATHLFRKDYRPINESDFKSILAQVKNTISMIFVLNPAIIQYIGNKDSLALQLIESRKVRMVLNGVKDDLLNVIDNFSKNGFLEYYINKFDEKKRNKIDEKCLNLLRRFEKLFILIPKELSSFATPNIEVSRYPSMNTCDLLWKEFDTLYGEIETSPELEYKEEILKYIKSCSSLLNRIGSVHYYLLTCLGDVESNSCLNRFLRVFDKIDQEMNQIEWIVPLYVNTYIWETARLVETNLAVARIMSDIVSEKRGDANCCNKYGSSYFVLLPALIKSLCDTIQYYKIFTRNVLSVEEAIVQFVSQKFEFIHLMDLYWAVVNEKAPKEQDVNNRIWDLQKKLIFVQHDGRDDDLRAEMIIRIKYAIFTLIYSRCIYRPCGEDFTTKFRILIFYTIQKLDKNLPVKSNLAIIKAISLYCLEELLAIRNSVINFVWNYLLPFL